MRYGCCVNMVTLTKDISGTDIVPVLKTAGFDYAELSLSHLCSMSDTQFHGVESVLSNTDLPIEVCNNFFPAEIRLTGTNVDQRKIGLYLDKAFKICRSLGVKVIVFGSGAARQVPDGFPLNDAARQLVDLLNRINIYALDFGITIAIEPLRRQECNIINTYNDALDLEKLTGASNIKCLLDYYHLNEENENIAEIQKRKSSLAHIHFSEPQGRVFPERKHKMRYMTFFSNLKLAGYNQRISIEAYSENFNSDAVNALQLLKEIDNELSSNH